jgi:phosphatidylserine/phosphatidylglycerophosphate/cardiolipin synthase-like enzyme
MASKRDQNRAVIGLVCEALESRELLATVSPMRQVAEIQKLDRARSPLKAPLLFTEPQAGRSPILQAINSARSEIRLGICNLSDPQIGNALANAVARGVDVRVIVDQADYHAKPAEQQEIARLIDRGVTVHLSNAVFPQSFEKELVIDRRLVVIMTMCLTTQTFQDTRDYGLVLADRGIIREITSVFDTDWAYSAPPGEPTPPYNPTPPLHSPHLIWGPTNATAKLSKLIQTARHSINATSEMLNDPYLEGQLIAAAQRGVDVRLNKPLPRVRCLTCTPRRWSSMAGRPTSVRSTSIPPRPAKIAS